MLWRSKEIDRVATKGMILVWASVCWQGASGQIEEQTHFEVVSIKSADGHLRPTFSGGPGSSDPGRISYSRASLSNLIRDAYPGLRIMASPSLDVAYFSVDAVLPPGATDNQLREMIRNMLIERFGLVTHREKRDTPEYELILAEKNAKLISSSNRVLKKQNDNTPEDRDGFPILPPGVRWQMKYDNDKMLMSFQDSTMAFLAERLTNVYHSMSTPVIDRTEILGTYDFKLALPIAPSGVSEMGVASDPQVGLANISGPLKRQIGLSLRKGMTSIDYVIVDHINRVPTPN